MVSGGSVAVADSAVGVDGTAVGVKVGGGFVGVADSVIDVGGTVAGIGDAVGAGADPQAAMKVVTRMSTTS